MQISRRVEGRRFVAWTVAFEAGLGILGLAMAWLFGVNAATTLRWSGRDAGYALLATTPMLFAFLVLYHSRLPAIREIHDRVERFLLPWLGPCSVWELAVIALAAGVGEELLFRGCLQAVLSDNTAPLLGWILASILFGAAHAITPAYGMTASVIGFYLGGLWWATGNLLTPIVAHAAYDFFAFLYYLRAVPSQQPPNLAETAADANPTHDSEPGSGPRTTPPAPPTRSTSMKAAYIDETGPVENIQYGDVPTPRPIGSEALVRVHAVSVNPIDAYIRAGMVAMPIPKPYILGCDLAGVVEEVGPEVRHWKPGDRVWGSNQGLLGRQGTFAQYATVDECWLYPLPDSVDFDSAAAMALVGITAHLGIVRDARLAAGEVVYVSGGSGGVGSAVVQMAKALGANVITTAGCPVREAKARSFGADVVVNYKTGDVLAAIKEFAPGGVNVWWETVREPDLEKAVPCMAKRGRIIVMAGRDAKPTLPLGPFYTRDCKLMGFAMFNAPTEEQRQAAMDINRWMASGQLRAHIDRVLPLSETAAAHRLQEENTLGKKGTLCGKIVLKP